MRHHIHNIFTLLSVLVLCGISVLGVAPYPTPAFADIQQIEEAPHQILYQSRYTLHDQHGDRWQVIAFKRIRPDGNTNVYLRLVGFPGISEIEHPQPITLTTSLGQSFTAADSSSQIFTDELTPESNVGQYDMQAIVTQLSEVVPLQITLPLLNKDDSIFSISPTMIQEWKTIAACQ